MFFLLCPRCRGIFIFYAIADFSLLDGLATRRGYFIKVNYDNLSFLVSQFVVE